MAVPFFPWTMVARIVALIPGKSRFAAESRNLSETLHPPVPFFTTTGDTLRL